MQADEISDEEFADITQDPQVAEFLKHPENWQNDATVVHNARKRRYRELWDSLSDHSGAKDEKSYAVDEACKQRRCITFEKYANRPPWMLSTNEIYRSEDDFIGEGADRVLQQHRLRLREPQAEDVHDANAKWTEILQNEARTTFHHVGYAALMDRGLIEHEKLRKRAESYEFFNWFTLWSPFLWNRRVDLLNDYMLTRPHHLLPRWKANIHLKKNLFCRGFNQEKKISCMETWRSEAEQELNDEKALPHLYHDRTARNWRPPAELDNFHFQAIAANRPSGREWHVKPECPMLAD